MILARWLLPVCIGGVCSAAQAQTLPVNDAAALLQKISGAASNLTYSGIFIHHNEEASTSSRITHVREQNDEWERIESIDGPPQEIIRRNEELFCYQPDTKTMRLDKRATGKFFPSLISGTPEQVLANYNLKLGKIERIGGHDCQWVSLEPRDALRFLQKLCAEINTGLLLRARTFNEKAQMVEQFTFTQLDIGKQALRDGRTNIRSLFKQKESGWQSDGSTQASLRQVETGWSVANPPSGFRLIKEMRRNVAGKQEPVAHLVFSDGIASISVFVEPLAAGVAGHNKAAENGMVSYAMRALPKSQVTVLGEVPLAAATLLANGVTAKPR